MTDFFHKYVRVGTMICCLFILLIGCTITTTPNDTETTTTTTTNPNPTDPTDDPIEFTPVETVVVSGLTVDVSADSAIVKWTNPTSDKLAYSEIYLYQLLSTGDYKFMDTYYLNKTLNQYPLTQLAENTTYRIQVASYTTSGAMDYVSTKFTTTTLTEKTTLISIAFRSGQLYKSDLLDGPVLQADETAKILVDKIPAGYTIDDIKWKIYWEDYGEIIADKSDDQSGDQYSEDPVVTFEEASQTLHAQRQGVGYVIAYINDYIVSNTLIFDIRDKIEKIKMYCSSQTLSLDPSDDLASMRVKVFYYDNEDNLLPLAFTKEEDWKSSDESIITINPLAPTGGVQGSADIIANGVGTAKVTLIVNGIKKEVDFTVEETFNTITSYTFSDSTIDMVVGEEYDIPNYTINPTDAGSQATLHIYTGSGLTSNDLTDSPYFEINGSKIRALQNASGWLRAAWYQNGNLKVSNKVCLIAATPLQDFSLNVSSVQLNAGDSYNKLTYTLIPENADVSADEITFTSNNDKITISDDGIVSATSDSGTILNGKITVKIKEITKEVSVSVCTPVTGITLDNDFVVLAQNGNVTLSASVSPDDATDKTVSWSSTSEDVATVDSSGLVTAVQPGITEIWASASQYTAKTTVVVVDTSAGLQILDADTSLNGKFTGYKTDSNGTLSFSQNDAAGKNGSDWVSLTNRLGWNFQLNDKTLTFSDGKATADNMTVRVKPILVKENDKQKVMFVIAMTNENRAAFRRGVKLGIYSTIMPNTGSTVTLSSTANGVQASDETINMELQYKNGKNETGVSSMRMGNAANVQTMIYSNSTAETFSGTTAGLSFSYQDLNFGPGSMIQGFFSISYSINEPEPTDVIVY